MKVKDFVETAKLLGLETASFVWKNHDSSAIVSTRIQEVDEGWNVPNIEHLYSFTLGNADLRLSNSGAEMHDYWLSLEGDEGNVECVKILPENAVQTLATMCEKYDLPIPTELVALLEAIYA